MSNVLLSAMPEKIQIFFQDLCSAHGFAITVADYRPDVFGNIQVVANNGLYSIDYRRDRDDESLFFVVDGNEYLVDDARELLKDTTIAPSDLQNDLTFLREKVKQLNRIFSVSSIGSSIKALEEMRVRRLHRMYPGSVAESQVP